MQRRPAALLAVLLLSACSSPEFRQNVTAFSTTAEKAVVTQNQRLAAIDTAIRQDLARNRVMLVQSPGCFLLAVPGSDPRACVIQRKDGKEIPTTQAFSDIAKLNKGVIGYAGALRRLASDQAEDKAAYTAALTDLSGALGQLQSDIDAINAREAAATAAAATTTGETGSGIGLTVIREITTLAFDAQRAAALRRIIIAADETVQSAMVFMSQANLTIGTTNAAYYADALDELKKDLNAAAARRAPVAQIAALQDQMFATAAAARSSAAFKDVFPKLGLAHAELAKAAADGADRKALNAAINRISDAVKVIQAAQPDNAKG